jgi:multiple sugar transport system permease protein
MRRENIKKIALSLILVFILLVYLFPFFFMVSSAFKSWLDAKAYPPKWIFKPTLENFKLAFTRYRILFYIKNSVIVAIFSTSLTILLALPASYSVARFKFRAKEPIMYILLLLQLIPSISVVFPYFYLGYRLNLLDTYIILIVIYCYWNIPWAVWIMRGFLESIPFEVEDQAMIDGCSQLGAFYKVVLPLITPGLAATFIFIFIACWNEFALAYFLTMINTKTLPTIISLFQTHAEIKWGLIFATATIGVLPTAIFALSVRKYFVRALAFGAIKE